MSLFLVVVTGVVFARCCAAEFINFDDDFFVTANAHVQAGLTWESLGWAWTSHTAFWHPLTWMSFQLDHELYGLDPAGFHRTNLLLHLVNVALLFALLRQLTGACWRSMAVALLFALHPVQVESVAWVSERKGLLSAAFTLLTLMAYVRYARRPSVGGYLLAAGGLALALLAKPMAVTLPALLLLLDAWPLGRFPAGPWRERLAVGVRLAAEKLPLLVLAVLVGLVTIVAEDKHGALAADEPLRLHPLNALIGSVRYVGMTLWPRDLTVFHPRFLIDWPAWQIAGALAVLTGVTALVWVSRRRQPWAAVGWCWFLISLAPVCGIIQVGSHAVAERYLYVPLIGLALIGVWGGAALVERWPRLRPAALGGFAAVVAVCANASWEQVGVWRSSRTLWEHTLRIAPDNWVAHNNLGLVLESAGEDAAALAHYRAAAQIVPDDWQAHSNLAALFDRHGRWAEASRHYVRYLELRPADHEHQDVHARQRLGLACLAMGQPEEAERHFASALAARPDWAELHANRGAALYNQGKLVEAAEAFTAAVRLEPAYASAHCKLGLVWQRQGRLAEAEGCYAAALRLRPEFAEAQAALGSTREAQGDRAGAIHWYRQAVQTAPAVVSHRCSLACALLDHGATEAARAEFREAYRLEPRWPEAAHQAARALLSDPDARRRHPALALRYARHACQGSPAARPDFLATLAAAREAMALTPPDSPGRQQLRLCTFETQP